ncbi:MAG TPA: XopAW family type III secretion system calcium-binding effector [Roseateles sp.]
MSTISGLGGVNRSWDSGASRKAEHEARMFAKVDSDGSGGVDATELGAMLEHTGQSGDSAELLKQMDGNGDGSLSSDELSQGLRELMPPPSSTLNFAQSRGAANDEVDVFGELDADGDGQLTRAEFEAGRPSGPPPGGMPPPVASGTGGSAATTEIDPLDLNQDGTVSQIERLAGELKELAQSANDDGSANPLNTEIAELAQKLYDQIERNWLQPAATATQLSTTA